jgi:hypothetical protein
LDADVARWARARVARKVAVTMRTVAVLLAVTVLAAGVGQDQWIIVGLLEAAAVARVPWHLILSVGVVTVGAGPVVERHEAFDVLSTMLFF